METSNDLQIIEEWRRDIFVFTRDTLGLLPAEPIPELRGKKIKYKLLSGEVKEAVLFDEDGQLVWKDLKVYSKKMFRNQTRETFERGKRLTWQQTVIFTAYNRATATFAKDTFDRSLRRITIRSGNGVGKDVSLAIIALHFLICFFGSQIGVTANTEQQLKDVFLKELWAWRGRLPGPIAANLIQTDDKVQVEDQKDWFLRARVARKENPEALQGFRGQYVLLGVDEASGVHDVIFDSSESSLTVPNWITIYIGNPQRTEGTFFDSHTDARAFDYTQLTFSSEDSPVVEPDFCAKILAECNGDRDADRYRYRVRGLPPKTEEMDERGWLPLFANVNILFESPNHQRLIHPVIGVDPSGQGKNRTSVVARDNIYMREELNEQYSSERDLARKIETVRDSLSAQSDDICIDSFGVGSKVIAEIRDENGVAVNAVLADKPTEAGKEQFVTLRDELAWKLREWCARGGIIVTGNRDKWLAVMGKMRFKRATNGKIRVMAKPEFKKEYPLAAAYLDTFDAALYTFYKEAGVRIGPGGTESEDETWAKANAANREQNYSSV
jgi:phage terminase large subunit